MFPVGYEPQNHLCSGFDLSNLSSGRMSAGWLLAAKSRQRCTNCAADSFGARRPWPRAYSIVDIQLCRNSKTPGRFALRGFLCFRDGEVGVELHHL